MSTLPHSGLYAVYKDGGEMQCPKYLFIKHQIALSELRSFRISHFSYIPFLVVSAIGPLPCHKFSFIYPQTWYIQSTPP